VKILLIEDDASNIELMRLRLESLECDVVVATNPDDGMAAALNDRPDLILADLKLGDDPTAGIVLVQALHSRLETRDIPLVIHSIYVTHPTDAPEALPLAQGYLPKPFKFLDLKNLVESFRAGLIGRRA
jgi:two-component system response regulator PilR (NtrC family)/two-component system response regulator AtoC